MTPRPRNLWPPELTEALRAERDRERDECARCGAEPCECDADVEREETEGQHADS